MLDGNQGVEPQTETVWRQADKYGVPRIIFVNKMDKTGADFFVSVPMSRKLGAQPVPLQLPIGVELSFTGIVDLIRHEGGGLGRRRKGAKIHDEEIPDDLLEHAASIARL